MKDSFVYQNFPLKSHNFLTRGRGILVILPNSIKIIELPLVRNLLYFGSEIIFCKYDAEAYHAKTKKLGDHE